MDAFTSHLPFSLLLFNPFCAYSELKSYKVGNLHRGTSNKYSLTFTRLKWIRWGYKSTVKVNMTAPLFY